MALDRGRAAWPVRRGDISAEPPGLRRRAEMRNAWLAALVGFLLTGPTVQAYVEAPHTLGQCCKDSTNVVLVELTKINKEKGLLIYKKVQDLKGKHPQDEIKHNIGTRGFHPREWQNVMNWAEVGKRA